MTKPMDDLISRQMAIDAILGMFLNIAYSEKNIAWSMALDKIRQLPTVEPEIIRCKDCRHFHYDMPYVIQGISVLGHEVCDFWGDGCKTSENGFCSFAERRSDG